MRGAGLERRRRGTAPCEAGAEDGASIDGAVEGAGGDATADAEGRRSLGSRGAARGEGERQTEHRGGESELAHRILAAGSEGQGYATAAGATTVPFSGAPQPVAQLFRERGLSAAGVTDRLRAMAERTLLRAPRPDAP